MPTRLRCTQCGERYNTAGDKDFIQEDTCENCGNKLGPCRDDLEPTEKERLKKTQAAKLVEIKERMKRET